MVPQMIYAGRILLAACCGIVIGWERQNRGKAAGIRTHFIISVASSLMMIISKYGFYNALQTAGTSVDVSRVGAGILAGVGLMSGGLVITQKRGVSSGITTAAGIWATVALGMSLGAGMYVTGLFATLLILLGQILMHRDLHLAKHLWKGQVDFLIPAADERCTQSNIAPAVPAVSDVAEHAMDEIAAGLERHGIEIINMKYELRNKDTIHLRIVFAAALKADRKEMAKRLAQIPYLYSYEF